MKVFILATVFLLNITCLKSGNFYASDKINIIEIQFDQDNWDELLDQLKANGQEERLLGKVVINGVSFDSVGVRYKGNSSYNRNRIKNPLNIKLDYVINDQELDGYGTVKLANMFKDPTMIREILSYEIASNYMPVSKANFAKVYINGTYLGLYSNVQDVDKYFMNTHYFSRDNAFFKGELDKQAGDVVIWGYLGPDSTVYENFYDKESDFGWYELIEFLDKFNNIPEKIESVLNVDRHLWMLAFHILMVNLDSPVNFGHNFYLYKDDNGRFNPVMWDLNENFGVFVNLFTKQGSLSLTDLQQLDLFLNSGDYRYPIISKILNNDKYKRMYVAHMKTIIKEFFSNGLYLRRASEIQDFIEEEVKNDKNKFYTDDDFRKNIEQRVTGGQGPGGSVVGIKELMEGRVNYLNGLSEFTFEQPVISDITHELKSSEQENKFTVTAKVEFSDLVQVAFREKNTDIFQKYVMFDDGNHDDGNAGDGIFGISIDLAFNNIQYYIYSENKNAARFSPERAEYEFYEATLVPEVVINELMADNDNVAADQDGEYNDWIELFNSSEMDVQLGGYYLSDKGSNTQKWQFSDVFIPAKGYLIVWADEDQEQEGLHTNFKLSSSGEAIYLSDSEGNVIDQIVFGQQQQDISYGRYPNGTGEFRFMTPTYSKENLDGITDVENPITESMNVCVYPNPAGKNTKLKIRTIEPEECNVFLYDIMGNDLGKIYSRFLQKGDNIININIEYLSSGTYYLLIKKHTERKSVLFTKL